MKLASDLLQQPCSSARAGRTLRAHRTRPWQVLVAIGAAGLVLQVPVQAKPIAGCLVQEADLLDPTACLLPPESLASTRPTSQTAVGTTDKVSRVTLDNIDTSSGSLVRSDTGQSNFANCSALRGTHEAQSLMLKTVQKQLSAIERDRLSAKRALRALRGSGADEVQLTSAASRLTQINAVWGALKGDVEKRTKNFNNSMSRLTKACLRG